MFTHNRRRFLAVLGGLGLAGALPLRGQSAEIDPCFGGTETIGPWVADGGDGRYRVSGGFGSVALEIRENSRVTARPRYDVPLSLVRIERSGVQNVIYHSTLSDQGVAVFDVPQDVLLALHSSDTLELYSELSDGSSMRSVLDTTLFRQAYATAQSFKDLPIDYEDELCDIPCYLTTAVCNGVGLPDDCFELFTLRRFRDQVLRYLPHGADDITHYNLIAPALARWLSRQPRVFQQRLYLVYILPCVLLVRFGCYSLARHHYRQMTRWLVCSSQM